MAFIVRVSDGSLHFVTFSTCVFSYRFRKTSEKRHTLSMWCFDKKKNTTDSKNCIQKKSMYVYSMLFVIFLDIQYTCAITLLKKKI